MIPIIGIGPGCVHLLILLTIFLIEQSNAILLESLINRSIVNLGNNIINIKHVGRSLYLVNNNLYGVLFYVKYIHANKIKVIWIKNGDSLIFNKSQFKQVFASSTKLNIITVTGITAGIAGININQLCPSDKKNATIKLVRVSKDFMQCKISKINLHIVLVYMTKINCYKMLDWLVCSGYKSKTNIIIYYGIGSLSQTLTITNLVCIYFVNLNLSLQLPIIIGIGTLIAKHKAINWFKYINM